MTISIGSWTGTQNCLLLFKEIFGLYPREDMLSHHQNKDMLAFLAFNKIL